MEVVMIIDNSSVTLSAQHLATRRQQQQQSLQLFRVDPQGNLQASVEIRRDQLQLSAQAMATRVNRQDPGLRDQLLTATQAQQQAAAQQPAAAAQPPITGFQPSIGASANVASTASEANQPVLDPRTQLIKLILERMIGRAIKIGYSADPAAERSPQATPPEPPVESTPEPSAGSTQLGMRYQSYQMIEEFEQSAFQAQGKVRTRDGREINFSLTLTMSRHYVEQSSLLIEAGAKLKDPLIINFDGKAAELHSNRFEFDLDADGVADQIHQLVSHSGMLALDKNGDGRINDGRELFGALSGDGFADLAQYDQDGNGFIDQADSVFEQLKVWIKDDQGNDQLLGLTELGVGALYLGSTDTPFDLKGTDNELQGKIRATGVFLTESGSAGTLQQLDLVV
jgi:hypothetical protein